MNRVKRFQLTPFDMAFIEPSVMEEPCGQSEFFGGVETAFLRGGVTGMLKLKFCWGG